MDNINFENINLFYHRHNIFSESKKIPITTLLYNELPIVIDGTLDYIINGTEYILNKGDIIFVPTGAKRRRKQTSADYISFNFYSTEPITCFDIYAKQAYDNEMKTLLKYYDICTANYLNHVNEKCTNILKSLLIRLYEFYNSPKYSKLTLTIVKYLKENIQNNVTLEDIKSQVFFSPFYFCKKFKEEMGYSIIKYFNYLKLEQAKLLINEQEKSLEEISSFLGFSDYNYFSRLFKKYFNISPNEYKMQFFVKP